jgi:DNA-directed RNA polymerase alpha subunit
MFFISCFSFDLRKKNISKKMNKTFKDFFLGCKDSVLENPRSFYGSFSLGPFKNSQSLTIANALRRTLLTEISNIAITHIEIDGVFHEYSTIDGVRESVLDILLNFKQIVLKTSLPLSKPLYGYLNVRGPGIVRASDFKLPPSIHSVDPDQYIATLNENGNLSLKFTISDFLNTPEFFPLKKKGIPEKMSDLKLHSLPQSGAFHFSEGKNGREDFQKKDKKTNSLWVDPNFNPIIKVNYLIQNLEPIGQNSQSQVIHIEIWTNGSIHPRKALYFTFDFYKNIFLKFEDMKYVNSKFNSQFFESEETLNKILKSYEYDYAFYDVFKKLQNFDTNETKKKLKNTNVSIDASDFLKTSSSEKFKVSLSNDPLLNSSLLFSFGDEKKEKRTFGFENERNESYPVEKLSLPFRITCCFLQNNLLTVGDILKYTPKQLQNFYGIGNFSLSLIQKKFKKMGFSFKNEK